MTKAEKNQFIDDLAAKLQDSNIFYLADTLGLNAEATSTLRRECYNSSVEIQVVKNTLLQKAFNKVEGRNYDELSGVFAGPTAIMFAEVGNVPARLIEKLRRKFPKPVLKAAYVDEACFVGDDQLSVLTAIKSKEELIGDVISLLQSPAKNVLSALQSGGNTISGLVKTLSER
ncbi:MAG: large subunit ribosomal protein L10 [Luteibaculaceae bacterium]|jgi:large subunit ribosomal protein L10